jgi:hypothetical protein
MICHVATLEGTLAVDVEDELVLGLADAPVERERVALELPRLIGASAAGSTVVALVERRPPLLVSSDAGATWREAGGGLPAGFAVAVHPDEPDKVLFAARNRLYLSVDGARFWRALEPELPDIEAVGWA